MESSVASNRPISRSKQRARTAIPNLGERLCGSGSASKKRQGWSLIGGWVFLVLVVPLLYFLAAGRTHLPHTGAKRNLNQITKAQIRGLS